MKTIIVSDLHIGSKYFRYQSFEHFLKNIVGDADLVLNGDIVENVYTELKPESQRILDILKERSCHQNIIWVRGNHDNGYISGIFGKVTIKNNHSIGHRLLISHGDDFDEIMPRNRAFIRIFQMMHRLRVRLGAKPVHVADYAKKWSVFYNVLRRNVMINAVNCAKENGFEAVACGHTHFPEDKMMNGLRYINTGAWTEPDLFYILVNSEEISLNQYT